MYEDCPLANCTRHTPENAPWPVRTMEGEEIATADRCPITFITAETWRYLLAYVWLDRWGKTPVDMGIPPDRVDPRYYDAMMLLKGEYSAMEYQRIERERRIRARGRFPGGA